MRLNLNTVLVVLFAAGCQTQGNHADESACKPNADSLIVTPAVPSTTSPAVVTFGAPQRLTAAEAVPVSSVLATPDAYAGKYVRITGVVGSVCPMKGCWLRVVTSESAAKSGSVFVKFPDPPEGRLVPMAAVGHEVTVEGTIRNATISQAAARHFLQDAGASQQELDQIVGPQKQVMVAQPAVVIDGLSPNAE